MSKQPQQLGGGGSPCPEPGQQLGRARWPRWPREPARLGLRDPFAAVTKPQKVKPKVSGSLQAAGFWGAGRSVRTWGFLSSVPPLRSPPSSFGCSRVSLAHVGSMGATRPPPTRGNSPPNLGAAGKNDMDGRCKMAREGQQGLREGGCIVLRAMPGGPLVLKRPGTQLWCGVSRAPWG